MMISLFELVALVIMFGCKYPFCPAIASTSVPNSTHPSGEDLNDACHAQHLTDSPFVICWQWNPKGCHQRTRQVQVYIAHSQGTTYPYWEPLFSCLLQHDSKFNQHRPMGATPKSPYNVNHGTWECLEEFLFYRNNISFESN